MEKKIISFDYQARYCLLGSPGPKIDSIWFVCHGYGQLAKYFIRNFSVLNNGNRLIVAPEGLSRFYLEGFSGKVGATWMTKEERENDITNYLNYLETLVTSIINNTEIANPHITLLGFSQGAATASRWMAETSINVNRFILWAGIFPPDLNHKKARKKLLASENYLMIGSKDPFVNDLKIKEHSQICSDLGIYPQVRQFEGAHEVNQKALTDFL